MAARNACEVEMLEGGAFDSLAPLQFPRRDFLKFFGSGLLVAFAPSAASSQESGGRFIFRGHELPKNISAWLHIAVDNSITVFTGKVEVGQNIRTSLAQQVAEELRAPFASISMVMGDTALTPWDMGTFGSRTTPTMGPELRTMAAAARQLLIATAARRWHIDAATLQAVNGVITSAAGSRSATYGEITQGNDLVQVVSGDPALTPATNWQIAGTPVPKADIRKFVTGRHIYPSDVARPGMMHGAVVRPSGYNATLESLDTSAAEKISGVQVVHDGDFIGIVAPDYSTARSAASAVKSNWNVPVQPANADLFAILKKGSGEAPSRGPDKQTGDVAQALARAPIKHDQEYTVQYIQHAPLEPRAAVAEWQGGNLTVWTGTQRPFGVKDQLVEAFSLNPEQVHVIQPDMGSGYGGKHTGEAAIEAARLAKAAGRPVKLIWTREEEFTWAYFRPAGVIQIRAGAEADGKLTAWEHHNYNSGGAALGTPYDVANQLIQYHPADSPLRQGSYRSLAAAANNFARESHMDSLAHAANLDPLEFRLRNLSNPRMRAVLQAAAEKIRWSAAKSTSERGCGIACGTDKGGYVATGAEIAVDHATKKLHVVQVIQAWESGAVINPDGLRNQQMGAVVQAIGGALFEQILFAKGKILNPFFAEYRVPRFKDAPQIEVVLLDRKDIAPAGAGEIGLIGLAPAVANAYYAATGTRINRMPMAPA